MYKILSPLAVLVIWEFLARLGADQHLDPSAAQ
jgi:hypothetical protein